jgi:hypothetical protein
MSERAYTDITTTHATVANRWMARTWSAMLGVTEEIRTPAEDVDWCAGTCPEWRLLVDDILATPMTLPEKDIEIACDSHGASIICRHASQGLQVTVTTTAFHEAAGLWRRVEVLNKTDTPKHLAAYAMDALTLPEEGLKVFFGLDTAGRTGHVDADKVSRAVAVQQGTEGLLLGIDGAGVYSLAADDPETYALTGREEKTLGAHEAWHMPDTFVAAYKGGPTNAYGKVLGDLLLAVRRMREDQAARAAASRA